MKTRIRLGLAVLCIVASAPFGAAAKTGGEDITYAPKGVGKVIFSHSHHVEIKSLKCNDCHYKTFQMAGNDSYKMDMGALTKGEFCGSCHNGAKAFDVKEAQNCKKCHKQD